VRVRGGADVVGLIAADDLSAAGELPARPAGFEVSAWDERVVVEVASSGEGLGRGLTTAACRQDRQHVGLCRGRRQQGEDEREDRSRGVAAERDNDGSWITSHRCAFILESSYDERLAAELSRAHETSSFASPPRGGFAMSSLIAVFRFGWHPHRLTCGARSWTFVGDRANRFSAQTA
jgi:hypothetical protein